MIRPIGDLDVPLDMLRAQIVDRIDRQAAVSDPRVGLNPTDRPRRSSAASRRKQARRSTQPPKETS